MRKTVDTSCESKYDNILSWLREAFNPITLTSQPKIESRQNWAIELLIVFTTIKIVCTEFFDLLMKM